jgi:hypothetical protein
MDLDAQRLAVQRLAATLFPIFILPEIIQKQFNHFAGALASPLQPLVGPLHIFF